MPAPLPIDADGALALLRRAERLFLPGCTGEPTALHAIIARDPGAVANLSVLTSFVAGLNPLDCGLLRHCRDVASFFPLPSAMPGRHRRLSGSYFGIDMEIRRQAPDILFVPVTLPDAAGRVTPGLSAEFVETAMQGASVRIAVVSAALPALATGPFLPMDRFTHVLRDDSPPPLLAAGAADGLSDMIAGHVARLVGDGAVLQMGIGKVPTALARHLTGRRGLRIHSGMVTMAVRDLADAGALDRDHPVVAATLSGDLGFYNWLRNRNDISLHPIRHTHHPAVLAGLQGLMAVNSAIEVDLLGQVNAERIGGRQVSAAGGLPDFAAAARRVPDGCAVIALPATDATGTRSRIVARLTPDVPVSVPRHDVDVVVTEHGIADLRGLGVGERAAALAGIAAPSFRAALHRDAAALEG